MRRRNGIGFVKSEKPDIDIIGTNNAGVNTIFFARGPTGIFVDYSYYYTMPYVSYICLLISLFNLK